jgi:calcineurin-like phosphoesterase family protein
VSNNRVFVTSDLHLGHKLVSELRGFATVEEHDEHIIQNLRDAVRPQDTLWILGDLVFNKTAKWHLLSHIRGQVRIVLGNHDKVTWQTRFPSNFQVLFGAAYGKHGTLLTHIPVHPGQKDRFTLNIHGHLHDKVLPDPWYFNVCLEQNGLKPFNIEEVYEKIPNPGNYADTLSVSGLGTGLGVT